MDQLTLFANVPGKLMDLGWEMPIEMTQETWRNAGSLIVKVENASAWWKGDWWNAGVAWGEGEAVCEELGLEYQTIRNLASVAKAFKLSRRRDNLPFSHHGEVLAIKDTVVQDRILDWCEEPCVDGGKPHSVRELREQIKSFLEDQSWPTDQRERRGLVEAGASVLANLKTDTKLLQWAEFNGLLIRIDRSSKWGNPFEVGKDGERDFVVESYAQYFDRKLSLHRPVSELDGKVLGCWCYPETCHGLVLLDAIANQTKEEFG